MSQINNTGTTVKDIWRLPECPSLINSGLSLSHTDATIGAVVHVGCPKFGQKPSSGVEEIRCLISGDWSPYVPSCEWSWNFSSQEKIIFGTLVAGGIFIFFVSIVIFIAYCCCYSRRQTENNKMQDHVQQPKPKARREFKGDNLQADTYFLTYLPYQYIHGVNSYGRIQTEGLDRPWIGYIPRPTVTEGKVQK